jgi:hypothetical protein
VRPPGTEPLVLMRCRFSGPPHCCGRYVHHAAFGPFVGSVEPPGGRGRPDSGRLGAARYAQTSTVAGAVRIRARGSGGGVRGSTSRAPRRPQTLAGTAQAREKKQHGGPRSRLHQARAPSMAQLLRHTTPYPPETDDATRCPGLSLFAVNRFRSGTVVNSVRAAPVRLDDARGAMIPGQEPWQALSVLPAPYPRKTRQLTDAALGGAR